MTTPHPRPSGRLLWNWYISTSAACTSGAERASRGVKPRRAAMDEIKGVSEAAGCTGIVLAKLDGTAKGGVVIPSRQQFPLPVKYVGLGERVEDLEPFNVDRFLDAMLDEDSA